MRSPARDLGGYRGDEVKFWGGLLDSINMEYSKRRLLIKGITKGLEKMLRVEEEPQNLWVETTMLPPTPEQLLAEEQLGDKRLKKIIRKLRVLLIVVPSPVRERILVFPGMKKIMDLVEEAGYENLPEDMRETLRQCGIWN